MAIVRSLKTRNYSIISNMAAQDSRLSLKAMGIYYFLITKPDGWQITVAGLVSQLKEGRGAVMAALKELEDAEYLTKQRKRGADGRLGEADSVLYDEPASDKPKSDFQTLEKSTQVITDSKQLLIEANTEDTVTNVTGEAPSYGDPDINLLISAFERKLGRMPRQKKQRWAAKTLMQRHGSQAVLTAIDVAAAAQGRPYAPTIASLEDLRDKWINLETFYKRTMLDKPTGVRL